VAEDVQVKFGGSIDGVIAAVNGVKEQLDGLAEYSKEIQATFAEMGEAIIVAFAVDRIAEFVEHLTDLGLQVERTAQQTGLSAEQIAVFDYAAARADVSLEELRHGLERFSLGIQEASKGTGSQAAAFNALGISVRDTNNNIKPMDDLLKEVMDRFAGTADNGNKTAIAMMLFGRQGADLIPVLDQGSAGLDKLKSSVEATGAIFSGEMQEALADTHNQIVDLDKSTTGLEETLFSQFKPAIDEVVKGMTDLIEAFVKSYKEGGTVAAVLDTIEAAINALLTAIIGVVSILDVLWSTARMVFLNLGEFAVKSAQSIYDAFHMNLAKADQDLAEMQQDMDRRWKENADNAVKVWTGASGEISKLWQHLKSDEPSAKEGESSKPSLAAPGDDLGSQKSHMQEWQSELDQRLIADQIYGEKARQVEEDFWTHKLALAKKGTEDYNQLTERVYQFQNQTYQQTVAAETKMFDAEQEAAKKNYLQVQNLETQKLHYLEGIYGRNSAQYQAELKRQEQMDQQHVKQTEQKYEQLFKGMFSSFNDAVKGMLQGTQTLQQGIANMFEGILESVASVLEEMAAKWLAEQIVGETASQTTAHTDIAASAARAGAAAYASTAAIPIIGPELAPAAGALAYGGAMAYEAMASFDSGAYSLNSDQIAKVHKGEMIVPARPAQAWRESMESGLGGGGDMHFHVNAVDKRGVQKLLQDNGAMIAKVMKEQHRNANPNARLR
jgi:hypothetical protein